MLKIYRSESALHESYPHTYLIYCISKFIWSGKWKKLDDNTYSSVIYESKVNFQIKEKYKLIRINKKYTKHCSFIHHYMQANKRQTTERGRKTVK